MTPFHLASGAHLRLGVRTVSVSRLARLLEKDHTWSPWKTVALAINQFMLSDISENEGWNW